MVEFTIQFEKNMTDREVRLAMDGLGDAMTSSRDLRIEACPTRAKVTVPGPDAEGMAEILESTPRVVSYSPTTVSGRASSRTKQRKG